MKQKLLKSFLSISIIIVLLVLIISYSYVTASANSQTYSCVAKIPFNHNALLLGTSKYMNNGNVNLFFTTRCNALVELWEKEKVCNIIISGDSASNIYDEPELMRQELLSKGVPDSIIILHKTGYNTKASISFCHENDIHKLTIVSQKFHNERAIVISKNIGFNVIGFNAAPVYTTYGIRVMLREWLARVKLVLELATL